MGIIPDSEYRFLGPTGLRVSSISLGGWITYGGSNRQVEDEKALAIFRRAYELGINFFDTAEGYAEGNCERSFGKIIKELGWKRSDYVISTKLFWGGNGVNDLSLCRKHLMEGINGSLERLQLDYVDIVYAHRPDAKTPMEEIVRGFTQIIQDGKAFYWGTSMWSAYDIEHAHHIATKFGLIAPVVEQPVYNLLDREWFEKELDPIFNEYGYGSTVYSPLATGLLTGKYKGGVIPDDSRYSEENKKKDPLVARVAENRFNSPEAKANFERIDRFQVIADELGVEMAPLALAVLLKNKNVSTLIIGASKVEQIDNNLKAYEILPKLTDEIIERIEAAFGNKAKPRPPFR